ASQIPAQLVGSPLLSGPMPFRCSRDNEVEFTEPSSTELFPSNGTQPLRTGMESCPVIEYDTSIFTSTIISEFHLVCERESLQPLFQMMYTVGIIFGSLFGGYIGDKWGRRRAVQGGVVVYIAVVLAMALVPSFVFVLVMRVMAGVTHQCMLIPVWSLALESCPTRHRSLVGMLLGLPYSLFVMVLAGVGYFVRTWKYLMLVCCAPTLALLPLSFIMDESARWLIQQERREEAKKVLRKAVRQNKAKLPVPLETIIGNLDQSECIADDNQSAVRNSLEEAWQYLRSPAMRTIILVTPVLWFLQSCLYLAVAINANNFNSETRLCAVLSESLPSAAETVDARKAFLNPAGKYSSPFLYVCLSGAMDASAILLVTPLTARLGRRVIVGGGLFVGGIFFLLDLLVPIGPGDVVGRRGCFRCAGLLGSLALPLLPRDEEPARCPNTLKDVDARRLGRKSANLGKENQAYENASDI
ncbi:Organic cation transporter protein, partial [Penaeus vannamei]